MGVIVRMMVMVRMPFSVLSRNGLGRGENESPGLDSLCADQVVGEVADLSSWAAEEDHFQASLIIEMNVCSRDDMVKMMVLDVGQARAIRPT